MAKATPIDALFDRIITELENALDLAVSIDRETQLAALAGQAERLLHLTQAALILSDRDHPTLLQNTLD